MSQSIEYHYFPPALRVLTLLYLGILYWSFNLQGLRKCNFPIDRILKIEPVKSKSLFRLFYFLCFGILFPGILIYWVVHDSDYSIHYRHVVSACFLLSFIVSVWPTSALEGGVRKRFWITLYNVTFPTNSTVITFPQVLLADILTSYSRVFGDLVKIIYNIIASFFISDETTTNEVNGASWWDPLQILTFFFVGLPYFLRFRQCLIEYSQSKYTVQRHLFNAIKYFTGFPVIILSSYVTKNHHLGEQSVWVYLFTNVSWSVKLWLLSVLVNSMYSFYWDICMDWDLGYFPTKRENDPNYSPLSDSSEEKYSFPYFLRSTLLFEDPMIYYLSIGINFMLRITWTFNLSPHLSLQSAPLAVFLIQWLELTRRWLWVYFRVEREYLHQMRDDSDQLDYLEEELNREALRAENAVNEPQNPTRTDGYLHLH